MLNQIDKLQLKLTLKETTAKETLKTEDNWATKKKAIYLGRIEEVSFKLEVTANDKQSLKDVMDPKQGQIIIAEMRQVAPVNIQSQIEEIERPNWSKKIYTIPGH